MSPSSGDSSHAQSHMHANEEYLGGAEWQYQCGNLTLDSARRTAHVLGKPVAFGPTEFALLEALLERPGFVRTRAQLLARLPASAGQLDESSIDVHMRSIRHKLALAGIVVGHVETVFGSGYRVFADTPERYDGG